MTLAEFFKVFEGDINRDALVAAAFDQFRVSVKGNSEAQITEIFFVQLIKYLLEDKNQLLKLLSESFNRVTTE